MSEQKREAKIDLILMASGNSKRFGQTNKLLYEIDGKPLFLYALEQAVMVKRLLPLWIDHIFVVSKYEQIQIACEKYEKTNESIRYIENLNSKQGITASIHLGVKASKNENDVLFLVCDQPYLRGETIVEMIKGYVISGKLIGCLCDCNKQASNPCIFSASLKETLMQLSGDQGGKQIFSTYPNQVYSHVVKNENELKDIDERPNIKLKSEDFL